MAVNNNEYLARFISTEGWFNGDKVKGEAFRPRKENKVFKTSVNRHDGMDPAEVKKMGYAWESAKRKNAIEFLGWADVIAGAVRTVSIIPSLDIEEGHPGGNNRHVNIVGWDIDFGKQLIQAEEVARQAKLNLV